MKTTHWILAFLLLSAVSAFADGIPGDPQMDPLPCSGSISLTLGAGGSLVTPDGPNLSASTLSTLTTPGTTVCYSNHTNAPIGGLNLTASASGLGQFPIENFMCPTDSSLFTDCTRSRSGDSVTFSFLQGNGTGVAGCSFFALTVDSAQVCGEFKFTAPGFDLTTTTFTASVTSVPEPSTLALMLPGVAYMGSQFRRRLRGNS